MVDRVEMFAALEEDLIAYNGKAIINLSFAFFYDIDGNPSDETNFDFPGYVSAYLYIYNQRLGLLIKTQTTQLTRSSNIILMNASVADMTFQNAGTYYYEMGYIQSGGYEVPLRYGKFFVK